MLIHLFIYLILTWENCEQHTNRTSRVSLGVLPDWSPDLLWKIRSSTITLKILRTYNMHVYKTYIVHILSVMYIVRKPTLVGVPESAYPIRWRSEL